MVAAVPTRLIDLRKADHDSALVDFERLLAIVTVGLVPAVGLRPVLHKAALLVPLDILLTVLRQRVLLIKRGDRIAVRVPSREDRRWGVDSPRVWCVFGGAGDAV